MAKHHRSSFPSEKYHSKLFTMIHSDVWGSSRISTMLGKRWFLTFIDDHTIFWVLLLRTNVRLKMYLRFSMSWWKTRVQ